MSCRTCQVIRPVAEPLAIKLQQSQNLVSKISTFVNQQRTLIFRMLRQNGPSDPSKLVGKRACNHIRVSSNQHRTNPISKPVVTFLHALYDSTRALHEQTAQMF